MPTLPYDLTLQYISQSYMRLLQTPDANSILDGAGNPLFNISDFTKATQTSSFVQNSQTSSFITNDKTSSMSVLSASWAPSNFNGSINVIPIFTSPTTLGNSNTPLFESAIGLGVGIANPTYRLHTYSNFSEPGDGWNSQGNGVRVSGPLQVDKDFVWNDDGVDTWAAQLYRGENSKFWYLANLVSQHDAITIAETGEFGINARTNFMNYHTSQRSGTGVNDAVIGGTYAQSYIAEYQIRIVNAVSNPNTYQWRKSVNRGHSYGITYPYTDGLWSTPQPCATIVLPTVIENGITIAFESQIGHTVGDVFYFIAFPQLPSATLVVRPNRFDEVQYTTDYTIPSPLFNDFTFDANTDDSGSITLTMFESGSIKSALYFASRTKPNGIFIHLADNGQGNGVTLAIDYDTATGWNTMSGIVNGLEDFTNNLTNDGNISWNNTSLTDWITTSVCGYTDPYYWFRIRTTTPYTSPVILSSIRGASVMKVYSAFNDIDPIFEIRGNGETYMTNPVHVIGGMEVSGALHIQNYLEVGTGKLLLNSFAHFGGDANTYFQADIQNSNSGSLASSNWIAGNDKQTDGTYYLDLGINSSTFNDPINYPAYGPNDSYLLAQTSSLLLNVLDPASQIKLMVGGADVTNQVATINVDGVVITGSLEVTGTILGTVNTALTASYLIGGATINTASLVQNSQTSSMTVATASFVLQAVSASYAPTPSIIGLVSSSQTGSFVLNSQTGSFVLNSQTGSFALSSTTSSYTTNASTASLVMNSQTSSMKVLSSSYSATASYLFGSITNAISASYAATASYFTGSISNAVSASYALSASYAPAGNIDLGPYLLINQTGSFAITGSNIFRGNQVITGSVNITGSLFVNDKLGGSSNSGKVLTFSHTVTSAVGLTATASLIDIGDGTIQIISGAVRLYNNPDHSGMMNRYIMTGSTILAFTDMVMNYVIADYNNGNPIYRVTTNVEDITESDIIPIYSIFKNGTQLRWLDWDSLGRGLSNKLHQRLVKTERYVLETGLVLSTTGSNIGVSAGRVWVGAVRHSVPQVNSATDKIYTMYNSASAWVYYTGSTFPNNIYDNGIATASMGNNNYNTHWIYRAIESGPTSSLTNDVAIVVGSTNSNKLSVAQAAQPPASLPPLVSSMAMLIGRIIVQQGVSTAIQVDSTFNTSFVGSGVTRHSDLSNLDYATAGHIGFVAESITSSMTVATASYYNTSALVQNSQTSSMSVATASFVLQAVSASYAPMPSIVGLVSSSQTGSFVLNSQTGSFALSSFTSSYTTNASTASLVMNSQTSSFTTNASTASLVRNAQTSSMTVLSSSYASSSFSSSYALTALNVLGSVTSASYAATASIAVSASWAPGGNVDLTPYVLNSQTSSFVLNSQTSSFTTNAATASLVMNSQTSSFVLNSQTSSFTTNAATASLVRNSQTSSMSVATASFYIGSSSFTRGGTYLNGSGITDNGLNIIVWKAPYNCTVTSVSGYRVAGTGATINARKNGSLTHLASALSVASADTWTVQSSVQNAQYAVGDKLEIMLVTSAGSPTQVAIQVDFSKP